MAKEKFSAPMDLGLLGILLESIKIPFRNRKVSILLSLFLIIPSSLLFLSNNFFLKPLVMDMVLKALSLQRTDKGSPEYTKLVKGILKDMGAIAGEEAVFILANSLLSLVAAAATIYASAAAYSGSKPNLRDFLSWVLKSWKNPLVTWVWISLFSFGCTMFLIVLLAPFIMALANGASALFVVVTAFLVLFGALFCIYLTVIWRLGLVASVLEEDCGGLAAIVKAGEVMRGRRRQGLWLALVLNIAVLPLSLFLGTMMGKAYRSEALRLAIGVTLISLACLMALYSSVVYTVYYLVCKQGKGEEIQLQGNIGYSMLSTIDEALP